MKTYKFLKNNKKLSAIYLFLCEAHEPIDHVHLT